MRRADAHSRQPEGKVGLWASSGALSRAHSTRRSTLPGPNPTIEIYYELDELAAKKFQSESSFEDDVTVQPDAIPTNNTFDLFEVPSMNKPDLRS